MTKLEGNQPGSRLEWLDLFRGCAALVVVGYHFRAYLDIYWMDWGFVAVQAFFVLSGVVLGLRYDERIAAGMPFPEFARVRLTRLYPMVFISGCVVLVLNVCNVPGSRYVAGDHASPLDVFLVTSMTMSIFSQPFPGWPSNSPVWSLWAELASNVVWFVSLRSGRRCMTAVGLLCVAAMLVMTIKFQYVGAGPNAGWSQRFVSLVSATAWFTVGYWMATRKLRPVASVPTLLILLVACVAGFRWAGPYAWIPSFGIIVVSALLINSLSQRPTPGLVTRRLAKSLGAASFPLYLVHAPVSRLLPEAGGIAGHWLAFLAIMGTATALATFLNEHLVALVQSRSRRWLELAEHGRAEASEISPTSSTDSLR